MKHVICSAFMLMGLMPINAMEGMSEASGTSSDEIIFWVSPEGNDLGTGSETTPFATLQTALGQARRVRQQGQTVRIRLTDGVFRMQNTLFLDARDSHTVIEAVAGCHPVISGGVEVKDWKPAGIVDGLPDVAQGHVWTAPTPMVDGEPAHFRQMWVGDTKMRRAGSFDDMSLTRLISVDKAGKTLTTPRIPYDLAFAPTLEMTIIQDWVTNVMRVKDIQNSEHRSVFSFGETESAIEFKRPWPILRADEKSFSNHFFYLSGAIQLLNRPQEWHNDRQTGMLYYWPRCGETPENTVADVPVLETLVSITGENTGFATDIVFSGITFEHTTWLRPLEQGHVPLQAGQWLYDGYTDASAPGGNVAWVGRPEAAVSLSYTRSVGFEGCIFRHLGSTAIDCVRGAKRTTVRGCAFSDIGGSAILGGYFGDKDFESHLPYRPKDLREVCDTLNIMNNYIAHPASEDWGCLAICVGFASNVNIEHNEIYDTPYSAISMGWGWTKEENCMHDNHIVANYIHGFSNQMRDAGAIYTLSSQANSSIERNRIEGVGDPLFNPIMWDMKTAQFDIYLDEGSDYFSVQNNWCERGAINTNKNGSNNTFGKNNASVSALIKRSAGLESAYRDIKQWVREPSYAPLDTCIAESREAEAVVDFIAKGEGLKTGSALAVDLTNNGLLDIVYTGGESNQVQQGGVRINKGELGFAATQGLPRLFMGNFAAGDLNGDGYTDLIQAGWDFWTSYNALFLNDGTGRLHKEQLVSGLNTSPACGMADVNGDGLPDLIFVGNGADNSFYIQNKNRTFTRPQSLLGLPGGFSDPCMLCADLNNDQTVDLFIYSKTSQGIYSKAWMNDGEGHFTEQDVEVRNVGTSRILAAGDMDGDGRVEIVAGGCLADYNNDGWLDLIVPDIGSSSTEVRLNDGNGNFTLADVQLPGVTDGYVSVGDFRNSGRLDVLITGNCKSGYDGFTGERRIAVLCPNKTSAANSAPETPTGLKTSVGKDGKVVFAWDAASDKETPQESLSYNFYVKDLGTGQYVVSPDACLSTGHRSVIGMGNAFLNRGWTLTSLPEGNYEWSVQTIDAAYAGSAFAPAETFTVGQGTTGIHQVVEQADSSKREGIYDLCGRRLPAVPDKGICIVNGTLVVK